MFVSSEVSQIFASKSRVMKAISFSFALIPQQAIQAKMTELSQPRNTPTCLLFRHYWSNLQFEPRFFWWSIEAFAKL